MNWEEELRKELNRRPENKWGKQRRKSRIARLRRWIGKRRG